MCPQAGIQQCPSQRGGTARAPVCSFVGGRLRYVAIMTSLKSLKRASVIWTLLATTLGLNDAEACGGLFCNAAQPVNQAAERIIFAKNDDGTVTAVIEIQYEGPAEEFGWVLPVPPGEAQVGVASTTSLDRIEAQSNPLYRLNVVFDEQCLSDTDQAMGAPGVAVRSPGVTVDGESGAVTVVASGTAGPYDYEQISVDPDLDDPAQVAVDWLEANNYDVGDLGPDVLRPYLEQEMNLIAFKLNKDNDSGSIRPIRLTYDSEQPFIPIRPTAVAANPDMGIKVWVLGDSRAIPQNYLHLELNEARIDWFNPNTTYNDVVIAAADEAGGQGFVTEQAGPAEDFAQAAFADWEQEQWDWLRTGQFGSMEDFLQQAVQSFGSYDGFIDVLSDPGVFPLRDGATADKFLLCQSCYFDESVAVRNEAYPETAFDPATDPLLTMDVGAFLAELDRLVISPLADTRSLFEQNSTVTRFYTTLSADEMTVDPAFEFNAELADVDNNHVVDQILQCDGDAEWRIEFDSGIVLEGNGSTWPVTEDAEMPYNLRVLQLSTSGEGDVIEDNVATIGGLLADLGVGSVDPDVVAEEATDATDEQTDPEVGDADAGAEDSETDEVAESDVGQDAGANVATDESTESDDGCGCALVGRKSQVSWGWLGVLVLVLSSRRQRRAR